jgi:hypothetical protein
MKQSIQIPSAGLMDSTTDTYCRTQVQELNFSGPQVGPPIRVFAKLQLAVITQENRESYLQQDDMDDSRNQRKDDGKTDDNRLVIIHA